MVTARNEKQQRNLRKSIAQRLESSPSHTVDRVARDFGVSPSLVYRACAEHGVSLVRNVAPRSISDPIEILGRALSMDEATSLSDLARELGVPRQQVTDVLERARRHRIPLGPWENGSGSSNGRSHDRAAAAVAAPSAAHGRAESA